MILSLFLVSIFIMLCLLQSEGKCGWSSLCWSDLATPKTRDVLSENMEEGKKCTIYLQPDWKYSKKSNRSLWKKMQTKPYSEYLTLDVTWGHFLWMKYPQSRCCVTLASQWPCWWDSHPPGVTTMRLCEPATWQRASTHRHCHVFWRFDTEMGTVVRKGPLLQSKQTGMVHRITCLDRYSASATSQRKNRPVDGTVTSKLKPVYLCCCVEEGGKYITIMRHVSHTFPLKLGNRLVGMNAAH